MPSLPTAPIVDLSHVDAIAYLRVSTEQQAGEKQTSLADQRGAVTALAVKLDRSVGHVFQDAGFSGATMEQRPAMRSLVASCEAHPRAKKRPGYVLVLNDSRWGRFPDSEEATYWRVHLSRFGWIVRFAELDDVQDDQLRPIMRSIGQTQASLYRKVLQANVRRGTKGTAEQGYWQARAPFGFARKVVHPVGRERILAHGVPKAEDEKVVLVPEPAEARIVAELFTRYATGTESLMSLVDWAIVAWPHRKWTRPAIRFLLGNPAYIGDLVWGRVPGDRDEQGQKVRRPDAEWYGKARAHEPLVSRELFAQVQDRMAHNRRQTRAVRSDWILSGIVRCRCGKPYAAGGGNGVRRSKRTGEPTGKRQAFIYRCVARGINKTSRCPYPGAVVKELLEEALLSELGYVIGSALHRRHIGPALDRARRLRAKAARTIEQVDRDLEAIRAKQQRLVGAIEADAVSTFEARERMQALRHDALRLTIERERLTNAAAENGVADDEREQLITLAMDFRAMAKQLDGPALRELIRPWIKSAVFDSETRELVMEIRRLPRRLSADSSFDTDGVPTFRESPGERLTVIRRGGRSNPELVSAATTRSRLSFTSPAGSPTIVQCGSPGATSTSTQMSWASIPSTAAERTAASTRGK